MVNNINSVAFGYVYISTVSGNAPGLCIAYSDSILCILHSLTRLLEWSPKRFQVVPVTDSQSISWNSLGVNTGYG